MNPASRALIDNHLSGIRKQLMLGDPRPPERFSLARAIDGMSRESLPGYERSVLEAAAANAGTPFDAQRVHLPWGLLGRDLAVGTSSTGASFVGTDIVDPRDILRGFSVVADAGVTMLPGMQGNVGIPKITTAPTVAVLADEQAAVSESTPVLGNVALTPKTLAAYIEVSRHLLLSSPVAERFLRRVLLGAVGQFLDGQILTGAGTGGELAGLFGLSGVQTQSGTSFNIAAATTMVQLSAEAGARDDELAFISTPDVRQALQVREAGTTNGYVWRDGRMGDVRAHASNDCPTASAIVGPWPQLIVAMWGPGPLVELNPYAQFRSGIVGMRVLLTVDAAPIVPAAFVTASSIT